MINLSEYRKTPDRLSDLLPWAALIAPGVVLNKDGSFQKTLQFRGPDLASSTDAELVASTARLNNALKRLGSGWAFYIEARRQPAEHKASSDAFPDPVSWLVEVERQALFQSEGEHFESVYFFTLQYLPPREVVSTFARWMVKRHDETTSSAHYALQLAQFEEAAARVLDMLKGVLFEAEWLEDSALLTYLHACVSPKTHPVALPETPMYLDALLADADLVGGIEPQLGGAHVRTLSVLGFPMASVPAMLDQLNHLPMTYRWVTRFIPLDKHEAEKQLKQYKRRWFARRKGVLTLLAETFTKGESVMVDSDSVKKSHDAEAALQALASDQVSFGYYTATMTVIDADAERARDQLREAERIINGLGFTTIYETFNAVEAWLSSLPGQSYANVRAPLMHSLNLAHLLPFSAVWSGPDRDAHFSAPPLFYARTHGKTPFRFVQHVGDVGHQMVIGPTGAGKSVLLNFMALQFLRYPKAQVVIFDKGGSFLASTAGVDGHYYDVGQSGAEALLFQPLSGVDDIQERAWAVDWLLGLFEHEGIALTPEMKACVWDALSSLAHMPIEQRTLTGVKALLQDQTLRDAVARYSLEGPYGELLDAAHSRLQTGCWQCFDLEALMNRPAIIAPILSYLFYQLEKRFDGSPGLLILDEAWVFLEHPLFLGKIRDWLKTLRKKNVAVVFATQSVDDVFNSSIAPTLLDSCPSRVYLPNPRACEPLMKAGYARLGLNEQQIQMLSVAQPKQQYYYASPLGSRLFELALGPLALAFCGVSQPEEKKQLRQLMKTSYADFLTQYFSEKNIEWATDLMREQWHDK